MDPGRRGHNLAFIKETFDAVILSDLVNDLWDVQRVLEQIGPLCTPRTRLIINFYSRLWELPLALARGLGLATPNLYQNWLTREDINSMLTLAGFETIRTSQEILWPLPLGGIANRFLVRFWPFREFALANFVIARPAPASAEEARVSVVIPARNEAGNIAIFARTPQMGRGTELIFVEGHSRDDTYAAIEKEIAAHPPTPSLLLRQTGIGKADAVRLGFSKASGDVLMILDGDLTVPPEDLPRFYDALVSGKGEFINGVRGWRVGVQSYPANDKNGFPDWGQMRFASLIQFGSQPEVVRVLEPVRGLGLIRTSNPSVIPDSIRICLQVVRQGFRFNVWPTDRGAYVDDVSLTFQLYGGAVEEPLSAELWDWFQDTFPFNETVGLPGTAAFDTTTALIRTGLNVAPATGDLNRCDIPAQDARMTTWGEDLRVDLVFRILPGPGNYVTVGNPASGLRRVPSSPIPASPGDYSLV